MGGLPGLPCMDGMDCLRPGEWCGPGVPLSGWPYQRGQRTSDIVGPSVPTSVVGVRHRALHPAVTVASTMQSLSATRAGIILGLAASTLWGVSAAVAAGAFDAVEPARFAQWRASTAALLIVPIALIVHGPPPRKMWGWLGLVGVALASVNVTFYEAIDRLGVGPGATIQFLGPIVALAWTRVVQGKDVRPVAWLAAFGAVIGVGLITEAWMIDSLDLIGVGFGLASAVIFAWYLLLGERVGRDLPPLLTVSFGFLAAAILWALFLPVWEFPFQQSGSVWFALVWVAILGTAVPFTLELAAVQRVSAGIIGVVATIEPAVAAVSAFFLLSQELAPIQILGGVLVLVAVATIQRVATSAPQPLHVEA